jgi:hypothetical protein
VPYVGGNGSAYPIGSAIASSGVLGLTATLNAGTLANGSGNLVYKITGTPTSAGNALFTISFGGKSCAITLGVNNSTPYIGGLACFGAVFSSTPIRNVPYVGTATVLYASGNGASYPAGSPIQSTGVTGLTATLVAGTLQNGAGSSGNLVYNISGTPIVTTISSATFALNFGTLGCGITVGVN